MLPALQRTMMVMGAITLITLTACVPPEKQTIEITGPKPKEPITIPLGTKLAPIKLDRVAYKIRRGAQIGNTDSRTVGECFYSLNSKRPLHWDQGRILKKDLELSDIFFESLSDARYNVVGNPKQMFANVMRDKIQPAYLVGASIEKIEINICDTLHAWAHGFLYQTSTAKVNVRWQVYSVLEKNIVYEAETKGAARVKRANSNTQMTAFTEAFANAAGNFAHDKNFFKLVSKSTPSITDIRSVNKAKLLVDRQNSFKDPITKNIDLIRLGVATVDTGLGHGSGVFIAPNALLTNHHVVGGNKIVRITLVTGRKILGEVVRKHLQRDVALIQVEEGGYRPLPIRHTPLKITEEVYAIGSPKDKDKHAGTVTKGIVSKFQRNKHGLEDIQADVDIHGGSSGGALLDAKGNLVGLTYAGISFRGSRKSSIGINYFIPIMDALRILNIDFKDATRQKAGP